jgi:hypothetical protein
MRRRTRCWIAVFIAALSTAGSAASAPAAAPPEWDALAREIAEPWPALIDSRGRFPDYVQATDPQYPPPMLGYALLQTGLRNNRSDQVDTGLRALNAAVLDISPKDRAGVFHHFALASAYNVARERLADYPLFAEHRRDWEHWLRRVKLQWLPATDHYANKYMVEAVAVLEMRRTGLRSTVRGSAMAQGEHAEHLARRLVNLRAPRVAAAAATDFEGGSAFVLSDPTNNALAYHALTFGFYARAVEMLGPGASVEAREALRGVARASWGLQAPDGDLSYIGRSQGMAWTLSLSAYGSEVAADDSGWGPRFRAVSERAIERLATRYGNGPHGLWITPSREGGTAAADRALDRYASGPSYAGLTLIGLNWAIEHADRHQRTVGKLAGDSYGVRRLSSPRTEFNVVRSGASWFAVRTKRSFAARDLRYDMGLVALKRPGPDGQWQDVVRPRPHTTRGADSAGPVLSTPQGVALPDAERSHVDEGGTVTLRGGYRARDGRWLRRGVSFRYGPVACGVQMVLPRRPSDRLRYSVWFTETPARDGNTLVGPHAAVSASPAYSVTLRNGGGSAVDGRLVRADLRFRPGKGPVRITICGR